MTGFICLVATGFALLHARAAIMTGGEQLVGNGFEAIEGEGVGLITNPTGRIGQTHLADLLHASPMVELTALFGPEHGIRGDAPAGAKVGDKTDEATGVPIHSLYGDVRKPTSEMLADVDVLLFDIQDIGARCYTYISTMGYAMQAAAEEGIRFVVLDRPNPLGGRRVEGFVLEPQEKSFVGLYPIPMIHGLTVGELAYLIQGEAMLKGLEGLDISVIEMKGWERHMLWSDLARSWPRPSPNIPDFETALIYPGVVFVEGTIASEGRGTRAPFKLVGAPWVDARALARDLNRRELPGVRFEPTSFTPKRIPGMASRPKYRGTQVAGVRHNVSQPEEVQPVKTGVHLLDALQSQVPQGKAFFKGGHLKLLAGTDRLRRMLLHGRRPDAIIRGWQEAVGRFRKVRRRYLLY